MNDKDEAIGREHADDRPGRSVLHERFGRRKFLGGTVAAGATAAVTYGGIFKQDKGPVVMALTSAGGVSDTVSVAEQVFNTVCSNNCWQGCYLEAHVRNGRLVKTAMNPLPQTRYNRICLRGLSHVQWVYHPARIKFPMKRVGPRGSGKWKRISWDEAVNTVADSMTSIRDRYGSKAFAIWRGFGNYGSVAGYGPNLLANVFQATGIELIMPSWGIDVAVSLGESQIGLVAGQNESLDVSNADLVIAWGSNLTEATVQEWHFVADAKDRGAKLVVIDPNFSITASKADKWIPLRPGSDPAFGLSVLNVLITEKLYDEAFVLAHTSLTFLVREDNGMFLRAPDGKTILVWDEGVGAAAPADTAAHPALTGSYTVAGVAVRPAFERLRDRAATWTPEYAQKFTEVPPDDVRWFARTYAATKKSFIITGMGIDRWWNGDLTGRAIATMAALTHNFGQPGAAIGMKGGGAAVFLAVPTMPTGTHAAALPPWQAYEAIETGKTHVLVPLDGKNPANGVGKDPVEVPWPIKAIWFSSSNAVSNMQNSKKLIELLKDESKLELVVVSDLMPTDTVRYADIVLPTTHWFENDDLSMSPTDPFLMRSDRALDPPFEAKSDYQAFGLVAAKLGYDRYFKMSERELADSIVAASAAALGPAGVPLLETWHKSGVIRFSKPDFVGAAVPVFLTPTKRLEPYSERVLVNYPPGGSIPITEGVDPLPHWVPPIQAWPDNSTFKKYPLAYMQEHSRWRVHTTWFDQPWLHEVDSEPYVDINATDARVRGISQGDYVEIFNDLGKTIARARVSGKMRPGMVNLPKGWQRFQTKDNSGFSDVTNLWINPITSNGSYFDNLVDVRKVVV